MLACLLAASVAAEEGSWRDRITFTASERARGELVDWFEPMPDVGRPGAERYGFFGSQLRAGVRVLLPHVQLTLELQDTRLANVPDDASFSPPTGNLGPGALYFANTPEASQGEPFLKLGFLSFRRSGFGLTLGRFEYRDGLETIPADPTLATVKRTRIAERLVGPFDFTHVTRSVDGGRFTWDRGDLNLTALAARPTQGGFEVSANQELDAITLAGLAASLKRLPVANAPPFDARLFWLFYEDARDDVLKVDNRPLADRLADHDAIAIHTLGAHAVTAIDAGPGIVDALAWTALQAGEWGRQGHAAWAWAFEAGYQLPLLPASPWLRLGYDRSSGDDDPRDDEHRSFFQLLPTARIYAQLPFYNLMNVQDAFVELVLRPHARVTIRTDFHWLSLTERRDLWYSGGGATKDDLFGYAGSASGGRRGLAQLADVSLTVLLLDWLTLGTYYGHAFGGGVVGATFDGRDADYGFIELLARY